MRRGWARRARALRRAVIETSAEAARFAEARAQAAHSRAPTFPQHVDVAPCGDLARGGLVDLLYLVTPGALFAPAVVGPAQELV